MDAEYSDLYISHSGDGNHSDFVRNLETSFSEKGFKTSKDNPKEIGFHRYFIVVLCNAYAYSVVRLDELAKIIITAEDKCLRILPVFHYVDPSDVRHQTGHYGQALAAHHNHVSNERLDRWVKAMITIADIIGLHIKRGLGKDEAEYIEEIYQNLSEHVVCTVGLHHRALKVMGHLNSGPDVGVCITGIYGGPGIGKSTVARRVHHCSSKEFSYHHFIDKAGEHIKTHGLESIVSKLVGDNNFDSKLINVKQKKFFLTFEDIDDPEPLKNIIQLTNMLGCGSKVVITTKDYHLLQRYGIERIYKVEAFNIDEAYELLSLKFLKSKQIHVSNVSIVKRAATFASNLPLLLEVIGSNMAGKGKRDCELLLAEYKKIRDEETEDILLIKKILRVSFNTLEECAQKKVNLHCSSPHRK
nr:nodulation protein [Melilotus officinalis]